MSKETTEYRQHIFFPAFLTHFQFAVDSADYVAGPGHGAKDWED